MHTFPSATVGIVMALMCGCSDLAKGTAGDAGSPPRVAGGDGGARPETNAPLDGTATALGPTERGVILVHAATFPSFRLCFENEPNTLPQPDATVMPEANVVGAEVGSAVRLPPRQGVPGRVFLFEEALIRPLYAAFGGTGSEEWTCGKLLGSPTRSADAILLGSLDAPLSEGVHLLVVHGCPKSTAVRTYTAAECGAGYSGQSTLTISDTVLQGTARASDELPVQVVHLSQALETSRQGKTLSVSFGKLGGAMKVVATDPPLFGQPAAPERLAYAPDATAEYATTGFRVAYGSGADAGALFSVEQSLARVQKLSSPRDLPQNYYAQASNYVLLMLGDPAPKLADGGVDDDERRGLHLLAVPVIEPRDAGADSGPDAGAVLAAASDGG